MIFFADVSGRRSSAAPQDEAEAACRPDAFADLISCKESDSDEYEACTVRQNQGKFAVT